MWTFFSIWSFVKSSASLSTLIGCGAVAVAIFLPKQFDWITDLRKWAIVVAIVAFSYSTVAGKFYHEGLSVKQAEWDAAVSKEAERSEAARTDAESSVPPVAADRGMLRGDPFNRNPGK